MPLFLLPAFILGAALLQQQAQLWPAGTLLAVPPLLLLAGALPGTLRTAALMVLALFFGFGWANLHAHWRMADGLPPEWEGRDIRVTAVVAELPQPQARGQRLRLDIEQVHTPAARVPSRVQVSDYRDGRVYLPGQRWQMLLRLKRPHATLNPHSFDAESWMLQQNIRATGQIRQARLLQEQVWLPAYLIERLRLRLRQHMLATLQQRPWAGLVIALSIGDQSGISQAQWQLFARTGLTHLVSISGLHVTLVAGLVALLAGRLWQRRPQRLLWLPKRRLMLICAALTALLYALLAGFSIPTRRTLYMLAIAGWALWSGRNPGVWRVLLLAAAGVVLLDPWAVLSSGFWLSFGAVACLLWASQHRLGKPGWLQHWLWLQWLLLLGMAPALLYLFQQLPLAAPLANALAIPLIGSIATPLCLLGMIVPPLLLLAHGLIDVSMMLVGWLADWPAMNWQQAAPQAWSLILAGIGIIWLSLPRGWPLRSLGALLLLPMLLPAIQRPEPGQLHMTMLDVGQGTALVLQTAQHNLLYDSGPGFAGTDSGSRIILPWLRGEGIGQLHGMVLSHDDGDHTGGAGSILQNIHPHWLLHSLPHTHPLLQPKLNSISCVAGQGWHWDGVAFRVLWPDRATVANPAVKDNDRSCVIRVDAACGSVLLSADVERSSELQLLTQPLKADILLVPHHGSKTSSSRPFIEAVAPSVALVSAGYRNRFGHPRADVLQRYQERGTQIIRSDMDGAVALRCDSSGWHSTTQRAMARRYWH